MHLRKWTEHRNESPHQRFCVVRTLPLFLSVTLHFPTPTTNGTCFFPPKNQGPSKVKVLRVQTPANCRVKTLQKWSGPMTLRVKEAIFRPGALPKSPPTPHASRRPCHAGSQRGLQRHGAHARRGRRRGRGEVAGHEGPDLERGRLDGASEGK